jgi:hypothetical protein
LVSEQQNRFCINRLLTRVMSETPELIYECIICGSNWIEPVETPSEGVSSGICPRCFREQYGDKVRRRQIREGAFDCFARSINFCDQVECCFRFACLPPALDAWEAKVVEFPDIPDPPNKTRKVGT